MSAVSVNTHCSPGMKVGDLGKNRRLILSTEKYEHHTPWPAFKNPIHPDSLAKVVVNILQKKGRHFCVFVQKAYSPLNHFIIQPKTKYSPLIQGNRDGASREQWCSGLQGDLRTMREPPWPWVPEGWARGSRIQILNLQSLSQVCSKQEWDLWKEISRMNCIQETWC